jgi:hypothetical protein
MRWRVPLLVVAAFLTGCSSGSSWFGSSTAGAQSSSGSSSGSSIGLHDLIFGPPPAKEQAESAELDCPKLDIRPGASTMVMTAPGGEGDAMQVRYQVSVARAARECALNGTTLTMKVGVEGRIALGPAGGPGQTNVPLRYALVKETLGDTKVVYSKLFVIPVSIGPGQNAVNFKHIDDQVSASIVKDDLDDYVLYIGFDPGGAAEPQKKRKPTPKAPKPAKPN